MRHWIWGLLSIVNACKSAPASAIDASVVIDAAKPLATVDASLPDTRLEDLLARPDRVEAWTLNTSGFMETQPGSRDRVSGYRMISALGAPATATFANNFSVVVLANDAYRKSVILCALGKAVGIRWTRNGAIAEAMVMPPCPSVAVSTNFGVSRGGQLESDGADRVFALVHQAYPTAL